MDITTFQWEEARSAGAGHSRSLPLLGNLEFYLPTNLFFTRPRTPCAADVLGTRRAWHSLTCLRGK